MNFELSSCQSQVMHALNNSVNNLFITGHAGTGKSFIIREFLKGKDRKRFPIVASTGAAAVLVGGRTFHSFFGLGLMEVGLERTVERALKDKRVVKRMRDLQGFILDEVSMITGEALEAAEAICRRARKKPMAWGGARVIAVGDFAQLPPISKNSRERDWAFLNPVWRRSGFEICELKSIMRSEDEEYIQFLKAIRHGYVDSEVTDFLNRHVDEHTNDDNCTYIFPRRNAVDRFNFQRLQSIDSEMVEIETEYTGRDYAREQIQKSAPVPEKLLLKRSAFIMIRVNDPKYRYVNGSVGTILEINDDHLLIELQKNGRKIELEKMRFSLFNADGEEVASATNYPVTLAYAITIHKSQGVTLDKMIADLSSLWEPGQAYVALSRLRSSAGLTITRWTPDSVKIDPQVAEFYQNII